MRTGSMTMGVCRNGSQRVSAMASAQVINAPTRYSLAQVARMLGVAPQRLSAWKRLGLLGTIMEEDETLGVAGLARVRRLATLSKGRVNTRSIRRSVEAMQRRCGVSDPLGDRMPLPQGARLVFRYNGSLLDPLTQQFGFDFEAPARNAQPSPIRVGPAVGTGVSAQQVQKAQQLFADAVKLEERPETVSAATELYREVLQLWPTHAPASINLGTILYNDGRYADAEGCYRAAAEIDPDYALAFFNLGNVLDELQRLPEAVAAYTRAIQIVPEYADVHYNLALAYERLGERRRALRHWMQYIRLDPVGPWAAHARAQAKKALATEKLSIVSRFGQLAG